MILFEKFLKKSEQNTGNCWTGAKKVLPLAVAAEKMPLELAAASRPRPSTGLDAGVQCIFQKYV